MKRTLFSLLICFTTSLFAKPINPIIGDDGYELISGKTVIEGQNENLRIQYHLFYVEHLLRNKTTSHLSYFQKIRRNRILNLLHRYAKQGVFPKNRKFKGDRKPCFIDEEKNICAVGYLVEKTKDRQFAEEINLQYQYADILDMDQELIESWAIQNGLTLEECAMIQPAYGWAELSRKSLRFSLGSASHFQNQLFSTFTLAFVFDKFLNRRFGSSIGLRFKPLNANNFALEVQYDKRLYSWRRFSSYLGVGYENYEIDQRNGSNIIPRSAIAYTYRKGRMIFESKLSYGYHINTSKIDQYSIGKHDLEFSMGLGFAL